MSHKVSLNRIIGNVAGNLGLENVNEVIEDFARWSAEAVTKIGSKNSYKRIECELSIKNFKADLPRNFAYPIAFKYKSEYLDVTKRNFRDFSKGSQGSVLSDNNSSLLNNQKLVDTPGVPLALRFTFVGIFTAGETISFTVSSNDCGNTILNQFTYVVQIGDTPASIALEFENQFNAIANLPYTAVATGDYITLTGKTPDVNFTVTVGENSILGSVDECVIQKRVPPKKNTGVSGSSELHPNFTSDNLANKNVTRLNTGMVATNRAAGAGYYSFGIDGGNFANVFAIDNGCVHFNALDDELIGIAYMGIDVDEEGWPLIYWEHEDAVTHYLQFMLISKRYYKGKVPQHVFKNSEMRWKELCAQARGDDELPDANELVYLANQWNQLIPLPNKNNF